jgi:hypothetical protein
MEFSITISVLEHLEHYTKTCRTGVAWCQPVLHFLEATFTTPACSFVRETGAPPPRPLGRQPEVWLLQLAALTFLAADVRRPRVLRRAAGAPPRLPLGRQPEVCPLLLGELASVPDF